MNRKPFARAGRLGGALLALVALALTPACAWLSPGGVGKQTALSGYQHFNLAMSYRAEGQLSQAAAELEKALAEDQYNYSAWYQLGLAYRDLGQTDQARQTWERGIVLARKGPVRMDYDRDRAIAEMTAALAGLEGRPAGKPRGASAKAGGKAYAKGGAVTGPYAVLYSSNLEMRHAQADKAKLAKLGYPAMVKTHNLSGKVWHRVWVGCCTGYSRAKALLAGLRKRGVGRDLVVMRVDR
ncbi:hypothetical protein AAU61_20110 [Desulfocarbo indianensis]|nr:hypothetical protein AAU61_20110 [Desulfocarbo indianensis]